MATEPIQPEPSLDIREQIARIDQIQADIQQKIAATPKNRRETRFDPFTLIFAGMGAAALFAAGAACARLSIG